MNRQINKQTVLFGCLWSCESEGTGSAPFDQWTCCTWQVGYLTADNAVSLSIASSSVS